jgi:methionyl-tRNA synthetase
LATDFAQLPGQVAALMDRAEPTQALETIWQRVRRCNRYVEERAPWKLAKLPAAAGELDQVLVSLAEAVRALSVLLHPYMPQSTDTLMATLGGRAGDYADATFGAHGRELSVAELAPLFPKR